MDEQDLKKKISGLERAIQKDDMAKSVVLLTVIVTSLAVLAGGLLLGAIFGHMGLCIMTAIFACIPLEAGNVVKYNELKDVIKRSYHQIKEYEKEIDNIRALRIQNAEIEQKKETISETKKSKYGYKKEATKKVAQKKKPVTEEEFLETIHEFYDDSEFLDQLEENNHKRK